jgi:hypothetical protein
MVTMLRILTMKSPFPQKFTLALSFGCLLAICAVLGCQGGATEGDALSDKPSILLISVDGLVPTDLSAFGGSIATPTLEALVAEGQVWPRAQTVAPMTRPAVASLLTGLAPDRHGVRDDLFATLAEDVPTVAERLQAVGYRTAAFPDSAYLIQGSGLWRGFELINDPPQVRIDPVRWFPRVLAATEQTAAFAGWAAATDADESWFSWIHLSYPLVGQMKQVVILDTDDEGKVAAAAEYVEFVVSFDQHLAAVLSALEVAGLRRNTAIFLVGTQADQRGGEERSLGIGYSLADAAVQVPLIAVLPDRPALERSSDAAVWTLDVVATMLELAGAEPADGEEGLSLTVAAPTDRALYSWSWAQHDQLGWERLVRVDRDGQTMVRGDGSAGPDTDLEALLGGRDQPTRLAVPLEAVQPFLDEFKIETNPIPAEGIEFRDREERRAVSQLVWRGRGQYQTRNLQQAGTILATVSRKRDQTNVTSYLDRGQSLALAGVSRSNQLMEQAVKLRPQDPDIWHWYAHSIWSQDWAASERILQVVEPYVTNKGDILYDLACTRSLAEDLDRSAELLEAAWLAGYRDANHMEIDSDLRNLRESGKFSEVMRRLQ